MRKCGNILYSRAGHRLPLRIRIAYWILKATNTHSEHVIPIAFPQQQ